MLFGSGGTFDNEALFDKRFGERETEPAAPENTDSFVLHEKEEKLVVKDSAGVAILHKYTQLSFS